MNTTARERLMKKSKELLGNKRNKILAGVVAALVTAGVGTSFMLVSNAADDGPVSSGVVEKIADAPSDYGTHMSEPADTSEVGRIKTDKTVRTVGFDKINRETGVPINSSEIGDNFTVTFSALSSGGTIAGESAVPADLVLILDTSISMNAASGNVSRAAAMIDAANETIDEIMAMNPDNRIAIAHFGTDAGVIVPLQSITRRSDKRYLTIDNRQAGATSITLTPASNIDGASSVAFTNGTNTQKGVYVGMNILANADSKVTISGNEFDRVPGVIIVTDGAAGDFVTNSNWWDLSTGNNYHGALSTGTGRMGQWFAPILEASYMKNKVSANYGENDCFVATVGFDLAGASSNERAIANIVLNPKDHVAEDGTLDVVPRSGLRTGVDTQFKTAYTNLIVNHSAARLYYDGGTSNSFTFNYPTGDAAQYMPENFKYNDTYVDVSNADELASQLSTSISAITDKAYAPTDVTDMTGEHSGYITFTDTIGDLMEVKGFKSILWVDHKPDSSTYGVETEYTNVAKSTSGDVDTYVFNDTVHSSWLFNYEDTNLNNIIITVDHSGANDVVTIKIPPALLPMVDYEVKKTEDGIDAKRNEATRPVKINYIVGPKEGVIDQIAGRGDVSDANLKAQIDAYVADSANKVTTGGKSGIALYPNTWRGSDESVVPFAEFGINSLNSYYSFASRTPLYSDSECTQPATSFEAGTTYYYEKTVYHINANGTDNGTEEKKHLPVTNLVQNDTEVIGGQLYAKAGSDKDLPGNTQKEPNPTATKDYQLSSHWQNGTTVHQHQGNNGRLVVEQPGNLQIDKTLTVDQGVTEADEAKMAEKEFTFKIDLKDSNDAALSGSYNYVISNPAVAETNWRTGTISNGGTLKIKEDETILIKGLPVGTKYTISEQDIPDGYTLTKIDGQDVQPTGTATGTIESAKTSAHEFTNNYSFDGNEYELVNRPHVKKVLDGRTITDADTFTMQMTEYASNPGGATINSPTVEVKRSSPAATIISDTEIDSYFTGVQFTQPGTYRFRITEQNTGASGITYSQSIYAYTIVVVDNGNGTMSVNDNVDDPDTGITMEKTVNADGTSVPAGQGKVDPVTIRGQRVLEATFTNKYSVREITIGTPGEKNFTDNSGSNPLKANMFEFEIRPSFYDAAGDPLSQAVIDAVPMPEGTEDTKYTDEDTGLEYRKKDTFNSATGDFGFGLITFGQADVGNSYRYVVQEIIPNDALTNGTRLYVKRGEPDTTVETTDDHGYLWHNPDDGGAIYDLRTITYKGYIYDCSRHVVTVTVTEEDGHIVAKVEYSRPESAEADKVEINNEYTPESVTTDDDETTGNNIKFAKKLVGRDSKTGEKFTFTMTPSGANAQAAIGRGYIVMQGGGTTATAEVDNLTDGTAKDVYFNDIEFKRPGTYTFSITENAGDKGGMEYDAHTLVAIINIVDNDGVLEIGSIDYTGNQTFTNTYTTSDVEFGSGGAVQIEKRVDGRAMIAGKYEFKITGDDAQSRDKIEEITADGSNTISVKNASSAADGIEQGTQAMTGMRFTQADAGKTFSYTATEVIPSGATRNQDGTYTYQGVTYAYDGKGTQKFTFKVTDEGDGTLSVLATNVATGETVTSRSHGEVKPLELHFANKYECKPLVYPSTTYSKKIDGRPWKAGDKFTFELVASEGAPEPERTEATVSYGDQSGDTATFKFGDATFTKPGTYTYQVLEQGTDDEPGSGGTKQGLTYDTHACTIQVIVTDKGDGTLSARISGNADDRIFVNKYHAEIDFDEGKNVVEAEKTLNGRIIRDREFMIDVRPFNVLDNEGEPEDGYASAAETAARFLTHYSTSSFFRKSDGIASIISGTTFDEKDVGKTYVFEVREFIPEEAVNTNGVKYGEATDAQKAAGGFKLDGVTYNTNGVDHYMLEIKATDDGIGGLSVTTKWIAHSFDHTEIAGKGGEVTSTSDDIKTAKLAFENTYDAEATATVNTIKDLSGRSWKDNDSFEFNIERMKYDEENNKLDPDTNNELTTPLPNYNITATKATDAVGSDGSQHHAVKDPSAAKKENGWKIKVEAKDLEKVDGRMQGDFFYRITEVVPGDAENAAGKSYSQATPEEKAAGGFVKNGVRYSSTPRYAHVHAEDLTTGRLTTDVNYVTADDPMTDLGATPVFTNYYEATDELEIPVTKALVGRDWKSGDSFKFTLAGEDGSPMPETAEGKELTINDVDGSANHSGEFGKIKFTKPDTYTYFITEVGEPGIPGIEYDDHDERRVVVEVTDNGDGTMIKEITYYTDTPMFNDTQEKYNGETEKALFTNTYKSSSGEIDTYANGSGMFATTKKLTGRRFRDGDDFTFKVTGPEGAPLPSNAQQTIHPTPGESEYSFGFGTIKFTEAHLKLSMPLEYTIKETAGNTDGITYDTHEEKVEVTLRDDGNGHIAVSAVNVNAASEEPSPDKSEFTNIYEANNLSEPAEINVIKDLQGRNGSWLESDKFNFEIVPVDINLLGQWSYYGNVPQGYPMPDNETTDNRATADKDKTKLTDEQYFAGPSWKLVIDQDDLEYNDTLKRMTGDFYYKVTEVLPEGVTSSNPTKDGMTYDTKPRYVHVHAEDDRHGGIIVHIYYDEEKPGDPTTAVSATPVFMNKYQSPTASIKVTKTWADDNNRDGKRTDAVMHLFKQVPVQGGGNKLVQVEVEKMILATGEDHDQTMTGTWTDLPVYEADGRTKITYVVQEESIAGYESTVTPATTQLNVNETRDVAVANSYDSAVTSVEVTKVWDDNNDRAGFRPDSVEVKLLADKQPAKDKNGADVAALTLNEEGNWTGTFNNLPEKKDGAKIDYTVTETALDAAAGYEKPVITGCASKGYTITNTRKPTYTEATVNKVWDDDDNNDGIRPNYVEMQLYKKISTDNAPVAVSGKIVRVTGNDSENTWTGTISGLQKYEAGEEIVYSFDEVTTPSGYTKTVSADGLTITNKHTDAKGTLVVSKYWDDNNNQESVRPADADFVSTLTLKADGTALSNAPTPTVSTDGNITTVTWADLAVYGNGGTKIKYSVDEAAIEDYALASNSGVVELTQNQSASISLRNHHDTGTKSVHFTKVWNDGSNQDGERPTDEEFLNALHLYDQYGREITRAEVDKTLSKTTDNSWTVTWDGLYTHIPADAAQGAGEDAIYHAVEDSITYYDTKYDNSKSTHPDKTDGVYDGGTVTNTHTTSTVSVSVSKKWTDSDNKYKTRPESITYQLKNGAGVVKTQTVTAEDDWEYTFEDLPKYKGGNEIEYTVDEQPVTGYSKTVSGDISQGYEITNTLETVNVSGTKIWMDDNNKKQLRPEEITLIAKNDDTEVDTIKADGNPTATSWSYEFTGLPKYDSDGNTVTYTVDEAAIAEYEGKAISNTVLINTLKTHDIKGTKEWVDGGKKHDNTTEVELAVYRSKDGETWGAQPLDPSRYHVDWKGNDYTISGLADTDTDGTAFIYKVVEKTVPDGYELTYDNSESTTEGAASKTDGAYNGGKIVNTIDQDQSVTVDLVAEKVLTGREFRSGDSFTFNVEAKDGTPMPKKGGSDEDVTEVTIEPTSGNKAEIDFGTITYSDIPDNGANFTYTISEEIPAVQNGIDYDEEAKTVTVRVERVDGILKATVTPAKAPYATFTNEYKGSDSVEAELKATKTLTGRNFKAGDTFRFVITSDAKKTPMPENTVVTMTAAELGSGNSKTFSFGNVTYDYADLGGNNEKVFAYTIAETAANQSGITYEENTRKLYVKVSRTNTGTMKVEYSTDNSTFTENAARFTWPVLGNAYSAKGTFAPEVTKAVTGAKLQAEQFEFVISAETTGAPMPDEASAKNKGNGSVKFGPITYTLDNAGRTYEYSIKEKLPDGVTSQNPTKDGITYDTHTATLKVKVTDNGDGTVKTEGEYTGGQTFTNNITKVSGETASVTFVKKWDDANDQDGIRPESISIKLNDAKGDEKATATVKDTTNWSHTFTDLPKYDGEGDEIDYSKYTVTEGKVDGYKASKLSGEGTAEDPFVITNKHTTDTVGTDTGEPVDPEDPDGPKKKVVKATKVWDDENNKLGMRDDVTLRLVGKAEVDGSEQVVYNQAKTIEKGAASLTVSWSNVPKNYNGAEISYEVTEDALFGYTSEVTGNATAGFTVKNTISSDIPASVSVSKEWQDADDVDGVRPDEITFKLMQKVGTEEPDEYDSQTVDVENDGTAEYTWDDLPIEVDGKPALYSVEEEAVDKYDSQILAVAPGEFVAVNTHTPETYGDPDGPTDPSDPNFEGIKVTKVWSDGRDAHGNRPDHVIFHLLANGKDTGKSAVAFGDHTANSWNAVGWTGLPKNDENGAINYSVSEDNVPNYDSAVGGDIGSGFTVTNTHNVASDSIKLVIVKEWKDEDGNPIEEAPAAARIHIMEKVNGYGENEVDSFQFEEGSSGDELTRTFDDMPTLEHRLDITYSIKEDRVAGYKTTYEDGVYSDDGKTLTLKVVNTKLKDEPDDGTPVILQFVDYLNKEGSQIVSAGNSTFGEAKKVDEVKPEKDPQHAGYDFQQWDMNYAKTENGDVTVVYVARYQSTMKVVSYVNGQGEKGKVLIKTQMTTDPSSVKDPAENPVHDGCRFVGWQEVKDAAGNVIRVAKFEPKDCPTPDKNHCYVDPPVRKAIKGHPRTTPEFTFTFSRITKNAPMPEGSIGGKKTMTLSGGGEIEFGWIEYTKEGTYEYSIAEEKDATRDWKYEASKFKMVVVVSRDKNGNLAGKRTLYKDGKEITNMQTAIFTNTYTGDDTDDGTYYDDDGDGNGKSGKNGKSAHKNSTSTGDNSNLLPWIIAMILAFASVNYILIRRKMEKCHL